MIWSFHILFYEWNSVWSGNFLSWAASAPWAQGLQSSWWDGHCLQLSSSVRDTHATHILPGPLPSLREYPPSVTWLHAWWGPCLCPSLCPVLAPLLFPAEIPSRSHLASYFLTSGLARTVTCVLSQEPVSYIWKTCFFYSIWLGLFFSHSKNIFSKPTVSHIYLGYTSKYKLHPVDRHWQLIVKLVMYILLKVWTQWKGRRWGRRQHFLAL